MKVTAHTVQVNELPDIGRVRRVVADALKDVADVCLEEANRTIPLENSPLMASGHTSANGLTAEVAYGTPYAVYQHETLHLRHDPGRRAQWLELTVYEQQDRYADYIAAQVRQALG